MPDDEDRRLYRVQRVGVAAIRTDGGGRMNVTWQHVLIAGVLYLGIIVGLLSMIAPRKKRG